jgi:hypothetical protein
MNQVSGKVLLRETGAGIPDLLVEIYDVDPATKPEEVIYAGGATGIRPPAFSSIVSQPNLLSDRLGCVPTGAGGAFALKYNDAEFRRRNPEEQRPDLLLVVRAPDEMDGMTDGLLHVSRDIRQGAGSREAYIIRIPAQRLAAAGIPAPGGLAVEEEDDPDAVIQQVRRSVSRRAKVQQEVQKIATEHVAAERARVAEVEEQVERRLLEKLTGVPDRAAKRLNYVRPGGDVEAAMFSAIRKSIEGTINRAPAAKGYLVLSESQAQQFRRADGTFRDDVSAEELEPHLFGGATGGQRPTFLVRESPVDLLRQTQRRLTLDPGGTTGDGNGAGGNDAGANGVAVAAALAPTGIPDLVGRLVETMTSPEEAVAFGLQRRATTDTIDGTIGGFQLHSGPADEPAIRDFYSMQVALDWVWQKAIDEGVIESAKVLGRQLLDLGGDPAGALRNGADPIKALRDELRVVQAAHAPSDVARVMLKQKFDDPGEPQEPVPNEDPIPKGPHTAGGTTGGLGSPVSNADLSPRFPHELLGQLESLLNERFAFEIFAPGSVNFGILVGYQQRWAPVAYQAGDLVKTLTLTPNETRKVSVRRVVKKERGVKEMENSLRIRKEDSSDTARHESEIVAKAEAKTNFSLTAQGTYDVAIAKGDTTVVLGRDAASNSSDVKKGFREAVLKAAQEYKDERKLEVETKESYEHEVTESSEIRNSNDEIPVTYLFYELQRRYKISEQIHRLTPVVLVAMDVPSPSRRSIDALLLTHGWIIDRVLLDDQFRRPLEYFRMKLVGEEVGLATMLQNLGVMRAVVDELKKSFTAARARANTLAEQVTAQIEARVRAAPDDNGGGFLGKAMNLGWEAVSKPFTAPIELLDGALHPHADAGDVDSARALEEAARERYERAVAQERELRTQLDSETAALKSASDAYARALAEHLNCLMDVGTLRLHIKENILYYMQAIWSHAFRDQLFLALHKKKVPRLTPRERSYTLSQPAVPPASVPTKPGQVVVEVSARIQLESALDPEEDFVTLDQVADVYNHLGFWCNYIIFPLRESNALTDFMMTPFVDAELGLRDPDELGNFTPEEFVAYARALHAEMLAQLERGEITADQVEAAVEQLSDQFRRLLSAPRRADDEITVPTGSLFIEALPGAHPILEDFKLMHRAVDVKKVQAEVRKLEMENLRYAARILEGEREDPDVEKRIVVEGGQVPVLDS